ncbi:MAG: hypothetical protein ACI9G1_001106 [Pirellulaceae bacterium]|jgi:hypothetical protein
MNIDPNPDAFDRDTVASIERPQLPPLGIGHLLLWTHSTTPAYWSSEAAVLDPYFRHLVPSIVCYKPIVPWTRFSPVRVVSTQSSCTAPGYLAADLYLAADPCSVRDY